jgi:hypothetical protein
MSGPDRSPEELAAAVQRFADQVELKTLKSLLAMHEAGVPPAEVGAVLRWYLADRLPDEARAWAETLDLS